MKEFFKIFSIIFLFFASIFALIGLFSMIADKLNFTEFQIYLALVLLLTIIISFIVFFVSFARGDIPNYKNARKFYNYILKNYNSKYSLIVSIDGNNEKKWIKEKSDRDYCFVIDNEFFYIVPVDYPELFTKFSVEDIKKFTFKISGYNPVTDKKLLLKYISKISIIFNDLNRLTMSIDDDYFNGYNKYAIKKADTIKYISDNFEAIDERYDKQKSEIVDKKEDSFTDKY